MYVLEITMTRKFLHSKLYNYIFLPLRLML